MTNEEALHSYRIMAYMLPLSVSEKVVEALEKQIPHKPIIVDTSENLELYDCYCPNCQCYLGSNISMEYGRLFKHHCECGQAIDWSISEIQKDTANKIRTGNLRGGMIYKNI